MAFLAYAIPELTNEVTELGDCLDEFRAGYEESANVARLPEWEELQPWVEERLHVIAAQLASQAGAVASAVVCTLTVFVVGLFWTVSRGPALELFLSLLSTEQQVRARSILDTLGCSER